MDITSGGPPHSTHYSTQFPDASGPSSGQHQAGDVLSFCTELPLVSCGNSEVGWGALLADLPVIPGTTLTCPSQESVSMARAPCEHSTLTTRWSDTCMGWIGPQTSAPSTTSTAWWTLCRPMTRRWGPAGPVGALLPATWPPAHHRPSDPAMDTPIPLAPKRPSGRGENLAMKQTGQALTAAGVGKDWGCLSICPPETQDVGSDLRGPPPLGLTWGVTAGRAHLWVIFQLSPHQPHPLGPPDPINSL